MIHALAAAMIALAAAILPSGSRDWGRAMWGELDSVEHGEAARFAAGCLAGAVHLRARGATDMTVRDDIAGRPDRMMAICAVTATGLGLAYMAMAGAPTRYLAMNAAALAVGFLTVGIVAQVRRTGRISVKWVGIALAAILFAASLFGTSMNGATRWVSLSGLTVQLSLILTPVLAIAFARSRDGMAAASVAVVALALALQPDRAMAGALAAGMLALAAVRRDRSALVALTAAGTAFVATMLQPDVQPAMPFVDQIFYSSFAVNPLAGLAVAAGALVMLVPVAVGWRYDPGNRASYAVFGAVWATIIAAAALGNYPTPLVGYGGSAIIGYVVAMLGLPRPVPVAVSRHKHDPALRPAEQHTQHRILPA